MILGLKFNWINDSQSNCFIVRSPICAMRPIFFSLKFLTRLSFSTFFAPFVFCFVLFFLSTILTISRTIFFFADYITMKSKLACPPNPRPLSPPISLAAPNLLPRGLFRRLLVYTGRWNPTTNLPHLKKVLGESYGVLYYTVYCRLHKERIISCFTDFLPVFLRIEAPPTRHSVTSVIFVAK